MGIKSIYQELVHEQPESFSKRGEYKIKKKVGKGATGKVVSAKWTSEGVKKVVALKIIDKETMKNNTKFVLREIEILKDLKHENVVSLFDTFESKHKYFLSLEPASGGNLHDRIAYSPTTMPNMREGDVIHCIQQLLKGVEYLHSRGIVHRDLKPENILYKTDDARSDIMIADFGIAAKLEHETDDEGNTGRGYIGESDLPAGLYHPFGFADHIGTLGYIAPDVLLAFTHTEKIDMWSIGNLVYTMLSGGSPWADKAPIYHLFDIVNGDFHFGRAFDQKFGAKDFIKGCLMVDHHKRISATKALSHPWLNGNRKGVVGYSNRLENCQRGNTRGITIYHMRAINAANQWVGRPPVYIIKAIGRPENEPRNNKEGERANQSADESDDDDVLTPNGSFSLARAIANKVFKNIV